MVRRQAFLVFTVLLLILMIGFASGCVPSKEDDTAADIPRVVVSVGDTADDTVAGQAPPSAPADTQAPAQQPVVQPSASPEVPSPVPTPAPSLPSSQPVAVATPPEQVAPAPTLYPTSSSDSRFLPISADDPSSYLGIGAIDVRRTSRDKGELKKMTLVVRNIGDYAFSPIVYMTFKYGVLGGRTEPAIIEQRFDLPKIEPGMKFVETYPVAVLFHNIDDEKTITLRIQEKYVSPPYDFDRFTMTFVPRDEFKSQEISWT